MGDKGTQVEGKRCWKAQESMFSSRVLSSGGLCSWEVARCRCGDTAPGGDAEFLGIQQPKIRKKPGCRSRMGM